jgi:hypothetical protein
MIFNLSCRIQEILVDNTTSPTTLINIFAAALIKFVTEYIELLEV